MAGTGKPLVIFVPVYGAAQVRANQANGDDALVRVLDGSRNIQPDNLVAFWVVVFWSQVEFGGRARIWLEAEEAEQAAQAKKSAQAKEGVGDEF